MTFGPLCACRMTAALSYDHLGQGDTRSSQGEGSAANGC